MSNSTTGEWTAESVGKLVGETFNGAWKIADAHNDAVAAEREKRKQWTINASTNLQIAERNAQINDSLREQLAVAVEALEWCEKEHPSEHDGLGNLIRSALSEIGEGKN